MIQTGKSVLASFLFLFHISITSGFIDLECWTIDEDSVGGFNETVTPENSPVAIIFYNGNSINQNYIVSVYNGSSIMDQPGFDISRPTSMFFMGYRQNNVSLGVVAMAQAFLDKNETNTVVIDWSKYGTKNFLVALFAAVFEVPKLVANMIREMQARGYSNKNIHLIGFSMGATIAGFLGNEFQTEKFPLITGLDPTGPLFGLTCSTNLNKGQAEFVQIIHGDRGVYATYLLCGNVDVLLNKDGFRPQPGCPCRNIPFQFSPQETCSHTTTWKIYAASIRDPKSFIGVLCDSYDNFKAGKCKGNIKTPVGYGVNTSISGNLYITTNSNPPYGKGAADTVSTLT